MCTVDDQLIYDNSMTTLKQRSLHQPHHCFAILLAFALLTGLFILILTAPKALAQAAEEKAIKATIRGATEAYYDCDADRWQAAWNQGERATRTVVYNGYYQAEVGWENFGPEMIRVLHECGAPDSIEFFNDNYLIQQHGDMAWVMYDQHLTIPLADSVLRRKSREHRMMVKQNEQWKISSQIAIGVQSFDGSPLAIEDNLNAIGYQLLQKNKVMDAIAVFKLNVQLFPKSWNVYDSLGEAYAEAGDTKQAIQNYQKSLELNPDSETGKDALARLQEAGESNNR